MAKNLTELLLPHRTENLGQRRGRPAGRVLLHAMVHLNDFQVEAGAKNLSGFAREPEEGVDAGGVVGRPDYRDAILEGQNRGFLLGRMSSARR